MTLSWSDAASRSYSSPVDQKSQIRAGPRVTVTWTATLQSKWDFSRCAFWPRVFLHRCIFSLWCWFFSYYSTSHSGLFLSDHSSGLTTKFYSLQNVALLIHLTFATLQQLWTVVTSLTFLFSLWNLLRKKKHSSSCYWETAKKRKLLGLIMWGYTDSLVPCPLHTSLWMSCCYGNGTELRIYLRSAALQLLCLWLLISRRDNGHSVFRWKKIRENFFTVLFSCAGWWTFFFAITLISVDGNVCSGACGLSCAHQARGS